MSDRRAAHLQSDADGRNINLSHFTDISSFYKKVLCSKMVRSGEGSQVKTQQQRQSRNTTVGIIMFGTFMHIRTA